MIRSLDCIFQYWPILMYVQKNGLCFYPAVLSNRAIKASFQLKIGEDA
jgi:hypothetical protein